MKQTPTVGKKQAEPKDDRFFIGPKIFQEPFDEHRACIIWEPDGTVTIHLGCHTESLVPIKKVIVIQPDESVKK